MDNLPPPRRDPLTASERLVVSALGILAVQFVFDADRATLLALVQPELPRLRRDAQFNALAAAADQLAAADTPVLRSFAVTALQTALAPILRRDMTAALRDLPIGD